MDDPICDLCGRPKSAHCEFVERVVNRPPGCVCEIREWGNPSDIPPVCDSFKAWHEDLDICTKCEHDEACHQRPA